MRPVYVTLILALLLTVGSLGTLAYISRLLPFQQQMAQHLELTLDFECPEKTQAIDVALPPQEPKFFEDTVPLIVQFRLPGDWDNCERFSIISAFIPFKTTLTGSYNTEEFEKPPIVKTSIRETGEFPAYEGHIVNYEEKITVARDELFNFVGQDPFGTGAGHIDVELRFARAGQRLDHAATLYSLAIGASRNTGPELNIMDLGAESHAFRTLHKASQKLGRTTRIFRDTFPSLTKVDKLLSILIAALVGIGIAVIFEAFLALALFRKLDSMRNDRMLP